MVQGEVGTKLVRLLYFVGAGSISLLPFPLYFRLLRSSFYLVTNLSNRVNNECSIRSLAPQLSAPRGSTFGVITNGRPPPQIGPRWHLRRQRRWSMDQTQLSKILDSRVRVSYFWL
ncbi:hypothetical protein GW17_00011748 [Ensete ventricosum]|nr:hypothetical protein GW17_00011748 [Ensete ventricosum]